MVSALWILFDVAISLRLVFVTGRMAIWEITGWATFGLALGVGAWVSEHRAERRHERAMGDLRDKLTEQAGFNRGSVAALGEHTAAMVAGVTRLLELAGGQAEQNEVRKQVAAVGTRDYTEIGLDGGHVGVFVSGKSQGILGKGIHDWLRKRD